MFALGARPRSAVVLGLMVMCPWGPTKARADEPEEPPLEELSSAAPPDEAAVAGEVYRAMVDNKAQLRRDEPEIVLRFGDTYDWMLTKSGEWVRGALDSLRDGNGDFDSEEFGPLSFKLRDIAELHMPAPNIYVFDDRTSQDGPAIVTEDWVVIETHEGIYMRPRDELWAIIGLGTREIDRWFLALTFGLSGSRGNSNQVSFDLRLNLVREDKRTLTQLRYELALGRADGQQNLARHLVNFSSTVYVTRRFFVDPLAGQLLNDKFQVIRLRASPAARVGARLVFRPKVRWDIAAGLGYQYLNLYQASAGTPNPQHDGIVPATTRLRFEISEDVDLWLFWLTNIAFTTIGNTNHQGNADLLFDLTNILNLNASFIYLRTEQPATRANGTRPVSNDYQFILGVTLELG